MVTIFVPSIICAFSQLLYQLVMPEMLQIENKGFCVFLEKKIKAKDFEIIREGGDNWQSKVLMGRDQGHSLGPRFLRLQGRKELRMGMEVVLVGKRQEVDGVSTCDLNFTHQVRSKVICSDLTGG